MDNGEWKMYRTEKFEIQEYREWGGLQGKIK